MGAVGPTIIQSILNLQLFPDQIADVNGRPSKVEHIVGLAGLGRVSPSSSLLRLTTLNLGYGKV